jgi:glucosamine 6-phosphate synthetase-like amidotransferase/phosphosugar isomerase protein
MKNLITKIAHFECIRIGDFTLRSYGELTNVEEIKELIDNGGRAIESDRTPEILLMFILHLSKKRGLNIRDAIRNALDMAEGRFSVVITNQVAPTRAYCFAQDLPLYVGLDYGTFHVSDRLDKVLSYTNQVIKLDDGVLAEMYEDGTCLFKDENGQRLNKEYMDVLKKEYIKVQSKVSDVLKKDFQKAFFKSFDIQADIFESICLS